MGEILLPSELRRALYRLVDRGGEHISAQAAERGRHLVGRGFFHKVEELRQPAVRPSPFHDGVLCRLFGRPLLHTDDALARARIGVRKLFDAGVSAVVQDDVVTVHHRERLLSRELSREHDRIRRARRLVLIGEAELHAGDELGKLPLRGTGGGVRLEIAADEFLRAVDDDEYLLHTAVRRLFCDILDGGRVDDGEHLFGHRFCDGQEPRAVSRRGDDRFSYLHPLPLLLSSLIYYTVPRHFAMPAPKIGSSSRSRAKPRHSFPSRLPIAPAPKHGRTETVGMRIIMSGTRQDFLLKFRRGRVIVDIPK